MDLATDTEFRLHRAAPLASARSALPSGRRENRNKVRHKVMSGWITEVGQMHKRMLEHPTTQTDILCPQCFETVQKTELPGSFIAFWCGCYARVFNPANPERFMSLSAADWSWYIQSSRNMKIVETLTSPGKAVFDAL